MFYVALQPPIWNIGAMTPLMLATHRNDMALVQLLIDKKVGYKTRFCGSLVKTFSFFTHRLTNRKSIISERKLLIMQRSFFFFFCFHFC